MNINRLILQGKFSEAFEKLNNLTVKREKKEIYLFQKALVLFHLEEYSESEKLYDKLLIKNNKSAELNRCIALVYQAQNRIVKALDFFEKSFELGSNKSIYDILNLIFERKGNCDYLNCKDTCCRNTILRGVDGKTIKTEQAYNDLMENPSENHGWQKNDENGKREWIFSCKHVNELNICSIYKDRPQICKDYPTGILSLKPTCSYNFELKKNLPKFKSKLTFNVIIDILDAYGYKNAKNKLIGSNFG